MYDKIHYKKKKIKRKGKKKKKRRKKNLIYYKHKFVYVLIAYSLNKGYFS